jgi:isoamylase
LISGATKSWHGVKLNQPDWSDQSRSVAFNAELKREGLLVYFIFNAYWEPLEFELPRPGESDGGSWRRWIDTLLEPPHDIVPWQEAPSLPDHTYRAGPRSVVVLWASLDDRALRTSTGKD